LLYSCRSVAKGVQTLRALDVLLLLPLGWIHSEHTST